MNKIKIMNITLIFIILFIVSAIYISKQRHIAEITETVTSKADLAFAVIGDVHNNINNLQKTINDLYSINPGMDALVLNGDTVDQGLENQYYSVKNILNKNKYLLPEIIIKNIGNHEFFDYDAGTNSKEQVKSFINRYLEFSEEEKVYHDTWIKNYHFISLGSEDGNSKTLDSTSFSISEEQLNWFQEKLSENYQKLRPIFVFLHQPLDYGDKSRPAGKQSDQIRKILSKYPEAILFSSHLHRDLVESSVVENQPFTNIYTGAIHYTLIPDQNAQNGRRREEYIKGLYIEVNRNKVVVKGRNIKDKKWIFTKEISKE